MFGKSNLILITLVALGLGGYIYWDSTKLNDPTQANGAESALLVDVTPATLAGPAIIGEVIFNAKCAVCHGPNGAGQDGLGPPLIHRFYKPSHHGDNAFLSAAKIGVRSHHWPFGDMPPVAGITPGEVKSIIAYIRTVQAENGIF